jgi:hypothetical protein
MPHNCVDRTLKQPPRYQIIEAGNHDGKTAARCNQPGRKF